MEKELDTTVALRVKIDELTRSVAELTVRSKMLLSSVAWGLTNELQLGVLDEQLEQAVEDSMDVMIQLQIDLMWCKALAKNTYPLLSSLEGDLEEFKQRFRDELLEFFIYG